MARVLIIDDEPSITLVLKLALQGEGYEVLTATKATNLLGFLRGGQRPDLILLDLKMPGLGGKGFLKMIREDHEWRNIPVILITGSMPELDNFPQATSYQALIFKPFDLYEVIATVGKLTMGVETKLPLQANPA